MIKGSESSLHAEHGFLNRQQYTDLSNRTQATFSSRRETLYNLFEAYAKLKRSRGDWDAPDRLLLL